MGELIDMVGIECPEDSVFQEDLEKVVAIPLTWGKLHGSTVLVTGATGAIGSQIVRTLLAANRLRQCQMHIIAMARSIEKAHQVFGDLLYRPSMEVLVADVTKVIHIDCAVDYIFHTAGVTASKEIVTDPVQTIEVSVIGTKNILDLAKEKQCKSVVFLSSMEVYGDVRADESHRSTENELGSIDLLKIRSCYPESKRMCENMCVCYAAQYGVPVKIARLAQTFGAGVSLHDNRVFAQFAKAAIFAEDIVLHTKGESNGNYCYTADAVSALLTILLHGEKSEAYNVVSENATTTIAQMAQLVAQKISKGRSRVVFDIPDDIMKYGYAPDVSLKLSSRKLELLGWKPIVAPELETMYERLIASYRVQIEIASKGKLM